MSITLDFDDDGQIVHTRRCEACTLCCRLTPIKEIGKQAGQTCLMECDNGCAIYPTRPLSCRTWSCRWLIGLDTDDLARPDVAGYVIDLLPDAIYIIDNDTGERRPIEVVEIWADDRRPEAWREDVALRSYIERLAAEGTATLVRHSAFEATAIFTGSHFGGGWREHRSRINPTIKPGESWQEKVPR